jgi:hypothetical protein
MPLLIEAADQLGRRLATGSWLRTGRFVNVRDFRIGMVYLHFGGMIIFLQPIIVQAGTPSDENRCEKSMA